MPIYEFGYRHWKGALRHWLWRFWPITRVGIRGALRSRLLRRLLFFAWAPLLYFGPVFFAVGAATESSPTYANVWHDLLRGSLGNDLANRLREDPQTVRPAAWSLAFYYFLGFSQSLVMMLVVAIVGPPLIAHDVRSKAFLLYFARPITRWEYLAGKAGVLLSYISFVTLLPALALYAVSIAFSPSLAALVETSVTVARIVAASVVVAVPSTLLVLYFSSLSREPRFAAFAWIATWVLGELFYRVLVTSPGLQDAGWPFVLSLRAISIAATAAIFDVQGQLASLGMAPSGLALVGHHSGALALAVLAGISAACLVGLLRRITAPLRI